MEKVYGYKESDLIALAQFIKGRGEKSLSSVFEEFATINGKAKGTVRNLYYALAKLSKNDKQLCKTYLGGKPIEVGEIEEFNIEQETWLLKKVLTAKKQGKSVRKAIFDLALGDQKTALRYQNKFRNLVKKSPDKIVNMVAEINAETDGKTLEINKVLPTQKDSQITEVQFGRLKREIDGLFYRVSEKFRRENKYLKDRVAFLEMENLRLNNLLQADVTPATVKYFKGVKTASFKNKIN